MLRVLKGFAVAAILVLQHGVADAHAGLRKYQALMYNPQFTSFVSNYAAANFDIGSLQSLDNPSDFDAMIQVNMRRYGEVRSQVFRITEFSVGTSMGFAGGGLRKYQTLINNGQFVAHVQALGERGWDIASMHSLDDPSDGDASIQVNMRKNGMLDSVTFYVGAEGGVFLGGGNGECAHGWGGVHYVDVVNVRHPHLNWQPHAHVEVGGVGIGIGFGHPHRRW